MTHLGDYFRCQCKCLLITPAQVARMLGYRKVKKGVHRLLVFEKTGIIKPNLLVKVTEALGMNWEIVQEFAEDDRQERLQAWEKWVTKPVPMRLVICLAGGEVTKMVPQEIQTQHAAENWACEFAANHRVRVWLLLNRRWSVSISSFGSIEKRSEARPEGAGCGWLRTT